MERETELYMLARAYSEMIEKRLQQGETHNKYLLSTLKEYVEVLEEMKELEMVGFRGFI